jgi:hypothetical protein
MQTFKEFLAEEMKDPEFAEEYERVSAEEDAKLERAIKAAREGHDIVPRQSHERVS